MLVLALWRLLTGCADPQVPAEVSEEEPEPTEAACDEDEDAYELYWDVWEILDESYPFFEYKDIDWVALGEECETYVCEDAGYFDFLRGAMECLLGPLRDHHVGILDRNADWNDYGLPDDAPNIDVDIVAARLDEGSVIETDYTITGTLDGGRLGYIRVDSWASWALEDVDVAGLYDQVGEVEGIVLDARRNGGGDPAYAAQLVGRFTSDGRSPYGWWQEREEQDADEERTYELTDPSPLTIGGRNASSAPFDGPVAVLLGYDCMSACEHFAAMLDTLAPASRSFGATTRGASGYPRSDELSDGETLLYASRILVTLADGGLPLEWNGVPPDELVNFTDDGTDAVLDAARVWMAGQ